MLRQVSRLVARAAAAASFALASLALAAPALAQTITGAGATFPAPIYSKWGEQYAELGNGQLNYQGIGSGAGVNQIINRTVDFGASDSPVAAEKLADKNLLQFPAVIGALVVIVNIPGVDGNQLHLTGELLGEIFLGRVRMWDAPEITALNAGLKLPHIPISPTYRADSSGTTNIFTNYLASANATFKERTGAGNSVAWRTGLGAPGNAGVSSAVKNIKGGIGYVEYAFAAENKMQTPMLMNKAGIFVRPTEPGFIAAAGQADWNTPTMAASMLNMGGETTWPIVSATYILLPKDPKDIARAQRVLRFFDWAFTNGGATATKLHYIPLPAPVQDLVRARWATVKPNGTALWPLVTG